MSENLNEKKIDYKSFSVLICVYKKDNPEHFKQALESIINQTVIPNEVVLVVDGPIPESINKVIKSMDEISFFKVVRILQNVGHGNARKIGLENCSNQLIALMDADDISVPDRFEKQLKCFELNGDLSVVGGNIKEFINSISNVIAIREVPQVDVDIKAYMKKRCPFNQPTVMFKHSDVMKAGGYQDWFCNEDYYLWLRMYQNGANFKNLKECLVYMRVSDEMYQRRGGWKYFKSEAGLQKYMLNNKIIVINNYIFNILIRFIVQVVMPNKIRGFLFKRFARNKVIK